MQTTQAYLLQRIVRQPNGCWLWTLSVNSWGYGRTAARLGERSTHRMAYAAFTGPIPAGMKVLHRCDTPRCVNPEHLFRGTDSDNVQDCLVKGRHVALAGEDNPLAKLTMEAATVIRAAPRSSIAALARRYGVSRRAVSFVMEGKTWKS